MIKLKQVIHYPETNSVEATWVDGETVIRCHSYADVQMQMFREDVSIYGGDISEYESLIAEAEANIKPIEPILDQTDYDVLRRAAYQNESDPLFFKWQAGEGTEEAWLAKRAEIKARWSQ